MNNYFAEGLEACKEIVEFSIVFNHVEVITYTFAYFSKVENETSEILK